jgi:hypothetical protein
MTNPTPLSPAAQAVWEAFNLDEAGVFVDYGDKLAAALRAAAYQVAPARPALESCCEHFEQAIRHKLLAIAAELEGANKVKGNNCSC